MALTKEEKSKILYKGFTDDSFKHIVRDKKEEYKKASSEGKLKLRNDNPDFIYLYDIIDEGN